ncbi:MAG: glycosyltransferase family 4 protein, partial [Anaerovoracaceae bacterium]
MQYNIDLNFIFKCFMLALIVSAGVTPLAIKLAPKIGAMDIPKDNRRMHSKPMPRFGGMAIFAGTVTASLVFLREDPKIMTALLGGTLVYLVGVVDDIRGLQARTKFLAELIVAVIMYYMGLRIRFIGMMFGPGHYQFGNVMCFIVTVLWIVGVTNTVNLIDGLDGLAAGVSAISCMSIAYVAYIHG